MSALSLVDSQWLQETSLKIRTKAVPWDGYQRASLVTPEELSLIKRIDRQPRPRQAQVFDEDPAVFAKLFMGLLGKLVKIDTVQAVLVGLGELIGDDKTRLDLFLEMRSSSSDLPFGPLVKVLSLPDEFCQVKASQILTVLLAATTEPSPSTLSPLLSLVNSHLSSPAAHLRDLALQSLAALLAKSSTRQVVWALEDSKNPLVSSLVKILEQNNSTPQILYQVVFCFWELTFERDIASSIDKRCNLIPALLTLAQSSPKEKVLRVVLATFANLITLAPTPNVAAMLAAKVLPFLVSLQARRFGDEDLAADLESCIATLKERAATLSTWDEYESELDSGHLTWSSLHESDDFWKENALKLNEKDGRLLKSLVTLLKEAADPTVLAVACVDVGQYVKHCDRGRSLVNNLGAKTRVMELMTHENPEVRYRALVSVQRLISIG